MVNLSQGSPLAPHCTAEMRDMRASCKLPARITCHFFIFCSTQAALGYDPFTFMVKNNYGDQNNIYYYANITFELRGVFILIVSFCFSAFILKICFSQRATKLITSRTYLTLNTLTMDPFFSNARIVINI